MANSRLLKLVIEYDGSDFSGFQSQGKGERTVQQTLEAALLKLSGERVVVHGAGRTDKGVHARGQVIHFRSGWEVPTGRVVAAMNGALPRDLSVTSAVEAPPEFHARFSAVQRTYVYLIWTKPERSALWGRFATHVPQALRVELMRDAARELIGIRDFAAFANAGGESGSTTVRDLRQLDLRTMGQGRFIAVRISANAFLRAMVRNIIGALLAVGTENMPLERLMQLVDQHDRALCPWPTAPPQGLCLWSVDYELKRKQS